MTKSKLVAESVEGEAISSVGSSSDIRSEFKRVANGSRFWALVDVNSSDDESSMEEVHPSGGEFCSKLSRLVHSGQGHLMAEDAPVTAREAAPVASRPERRLKDRKQQSQHPKSMRLCSKAGRPWKGPIPLARAVQVWSIGDLWVEDGQKGRRGSRSKLSELLEGECSPPPPVKTPEAEKDVL